MNLRPLHDHVIIRRKEERHLSQEGIVISDSAIEKPLWGEVVAACNDRVMSNGKVAAVEVGVGDGTTTATVLLVKTFFAGTDVAQLAVAKCQYAYEA